MDHLSSFIAIVNSAMRQDSIIVRAPNNKMIRMLALKLLHLGVIGGFSILSKKSILIHTKIHRHTTGVSGITSIKRVSTPGKRVYVKASYLRTNSNKSHGLCSPLFLVSTSFGLLTASEAILANKGGELILSIN